MDIIDWLNKLAARRRTAWGEAGMDGCRYEEAAAELGRLRAEVERLRADENERCARIAEGQAEFVAGDTHEQLCHHIAAMIRAALAPAGKGQTSGVADGPN